MVRLAVVGVYMPGMPPIVLAPPPAIIGGSSSRISVIRQLVVSTDAAIEHELPIACCVTVAGLRSRPSRRGRRTRRWRRSSRDGLLVLHLLEDERALLAGVEGDLVDRYVLEIARERGGGVRVWARGYVGRDQTFGA